MKKNERVKVLFMCDGIALAHFVRTMFLISCLDREKYQLILAASAEYQDRAKGKVDAFIPMKCLSAQEFEQRSDTLTGKHIYDREVLDMYLESDKEIINKVQPDLIVGDLRVSLGITAKLYKVPYINVQNAYWSIYGTAEFPMPDLSVFKMILCILMLMNPIRIQKNFTRAYNEICREHNLPEVKTFGEFYTTGDLNLYVDVPLLAPTKNLPKEGHKYIGPILDFIDCPLPKWWGEIQKSNKKIIYCSVGSTGSVKKIKKLVKALEQVDATVIMVTAGKLAEDFFPEKFYVAKYLPAMEVIDKVDLVIFNGGSGTLYQAMAKGKPILALPTGADQFMASSQVKKLQVGYSLRTIQMRHKKLIKVLNELLTNDIYQKNAEEVMNEISQYNVKERFLSQFEGNLETLLSKY